MKNSIKVIKNSFEDKEPAEEKKAEREPVRRDNDDKGHKGRMTSAQLIPLSFLAAIAIGTLILMLPFSTVEGESTSLLTALFTSTTSFCVTGLVVVDTFAHWTLFGKIMILIMIQLGGMGIIAVTSILMLMLHKRFSMNQFVIIHDSFNLDSMAGLMRFLVKVFEGTFIVEGFGAFLYAFTFIPQFGVAKGIWVSVFTAISAFCNAGIDIIGPDSLISYNSNNLVMYTSMMLIIMGGLGYVVWFDMITGIRTGIKKKYSLITIFKHFGEHTRLVINLTIFLIFIGAAVVFVSEYDNPETIGNMSMYDKLLNSIFQSVTFRTAGFAAVPQQSLRDSTCVIGAFLMFIGGSPVGTAGGVKTVTMFFVILNAVSFIRNRNEAVVYNRRLPSDMIRKSSAIIMVSFMVTMIFLFLMLCTNDISMTDAVYETFSATATVGLSRACTPLLNAAGRIIIILCMFLGRIGPISMALFFNFKGSEKNKVSFAEGRFYVG